MTGAVLTERQKKWFATVQANFETATGRPLAAWVEIMKTCPETAPRAQAAWLKANHGLGVSHAAQVLDACRPSEGGRALLGLKLDPAASARLTPAVRKESWSERLSTIIELDDAAAVDGAVARLFAAAADNG